MHTEKENTYGSLCTEMYERLHREAPEDELNFYLSYAQPGMKILEPLCGSGRFLAPFMARGLDICGMDRSGEMLAKLREKAPEARAVQADLASYAPGEQYDYIFITSGSVSLFTDMAQCRAVLARLREMLAPGGRLVFAVDTVANRCPDDGEWRVDAEAEAGAGRRLVLRTKNRYAPQTQTQFSLGRYTLYDGERPLREEYMDFQTHLYRFGEMEAYLAELDFARVRTYSAFDRTPAAGDGDGMFLFDCLTPGEEGRAVTYRQLTEEEICPALFQGFIRRQVVDLCLRRENGAWVVRPDPFVDDWSAEDYQTLIRCLRNTVHTGGLVCGAFQGERLKGFVSVEAGLFGGENRYLDLSSLHVSADLRRAGVGRTLFRRAADWAAAHGADKLYISAHSAVETQAFYRAMGCVEAAEYQQKHVEAEPFDCQMECALKKTGHNRR